jgi:hypothetical protein
MNINYTIKAKLDDLLSDYGIYNYELDQYLKFLPGSSERRAKSVELIQAIMTAHGKESLHKYLTELGRIEAGIQELEPWVRDHISHAIHCFVLGIFINEYYLFDNFNLRISTFQWKLTGLFHDIGYPVEIAKNLLTPYNNIINEIGIELGLPSEEEPMFKVTYDKLISLSHGIDSLNLIQKQLADWGLNINVQHEYSSRKKAGKVCHGMISSLLLLKVLDKMYEAFNPTRKFRDIYKEGSNINWNQYYFINDVIPACSSIFIHNLPSQSFNGAKIDPQKAPLAFLLKLSDTLQEWERSSKDLPRGLSSDSFDLIYENNSITIKTLIDQTIVDKINRELADFLEIDNIRLERI